MSSRAVRLLNSSSRLKLRNEAALYFGGMAASFAKEELMIK